MHPTKKKKNRNKKLINIETLQLSFRIFDWVNSKKKKKGL